MKKVLAAVGCGLVAACIALSGCSSLSSTDYDALIADFYDQYPQLEGSLKGSYESLDDYYDDVTQVLDDYYASQANDGSSATGIQTVYDYETDAFGNAVADDDGNYNNHRPDYDSLFDYESGYEPSVPEPPGATITLSYQMPEEIGFSSSTWAEEAVRYTVDSETGEATYYDEFDPDSEDNLISGDTIRLPSRNSLEKTRYYGHAFEGWMLVYKNGTTAGPYSANADVELTGSATLYPCFADSDPDLSAWSCDTHFNYRGENESDTSYGTGSVSVSTTNFNTQAYRYELTVDSQADYMFRLIAKDGDTAISLAAGSHTLRVWLTNYNSSDISIKLGPESSGYSYNGWTYITSTTTTIAAGETQYVDMSFTTSEAYSTMIVFENDNPDTTSWFDTDNVLHLGVIIDLDVDDSSTPVTINTDLPSGVTLKTAVPQNLYIGDTLGSSELPSQSQMTFTGSSDSAFGGRTLQGWYVKQTNEDKSTTNTIIGSSGLELDSSEITIAPYWDYPLGTAMLKFNSGTSNGDYLDTNCSNCSYNTYTAAHSEYTTVIDPVKTDNDSAFDYAVPAINLTNTSSTRGVQSADKFRVSTDVSGVIGHDFDYAQDNIFFYEFQNQGTEDIYFKFTLVNTSTTADTSYMYIYLAPGETVTYIISAEFSHQPSRDDPLTQSNAMIYLEAQQDASSLNLAVAVGFLEGVSTTEHAGTFSISNLISQGFNVYSGDETLTEGNYSSASYSESDFIAYITNSTKGSLNSESNVYEIKGSGLATTSLLVSYSLDDAYVSSNKKV